MKYLPEYEYQKEPSREWVGNLVNTLIHDQFQEYMNDKISEREAELSKQKTYSSMQLLKLLILSKDLMLFQLQKENHIFS